VTAPAAKRLPFCRIRNAGALWTVERVYALEPADVVVLAIGLHAPDSAQALADLYDLDLERHCAKRQLARAALRTAGRDGT